MTRLYWRIFLAFWAVMAIIVAGTMAVNVVGLRTELDRARTETLQGSLEALSEQAQRALDAGGPDGLRHWLESRVPLPPTPRIFIVDPAGQDILGRTRPPPLLGRLFRGAPPAGAPPADAPGARAITGPGGERYVLYVPPHRPPPGAWLFNPEARLAVLALALLVSGSICFLLARQLTRPIRSLREVGARIGEGDLSARVDESVTRRPDELGTLGREFNRTAERIEALIAGRERLLRDVSHELRSPLARLQTAVGLARQQGGTGGPLDRIEHEAERLNELVGQILSFTRVDTRGEAARQRLDLAELLAEVAEDARYEAQPKGTVVASEGESSAPFDGDEALLRSAIENVLRNAVEHARHEVRVTLARATSPDGWRVTIRDDGPGVATRDLEHLAEPFYRAEGSTHRGSGLGLAIAARALRLHGGSLACANASGGGLVVTLWLPG